MSKGWKIFIVLFCIMLIEFIIYFAITPGGRATWNNWFFSVQKTDDKTLYSTRKQVEDTCRAMISSYTSDMLIYEQYKDNNNTEKQSWAEQAKMRANKTAASYNEYILKNSFVFEDNIPQDIQQSLKYLQ